MAPYSSIHRACSVQFEASCIQSPRQEKVFQSIKSTTLCLLRILYFSIMLILLSGVHFRALALYFYSFLSFGRSSLSLPEPAILIY